MTDLLCCCTRQRDSHQGRGYRVLAGRRGLAVSYNHSTSSTHSAAVGNAYEAPLVTPSGKPPCFEDFILHKTIGRGSFGRVFLAEHHPVKRLFALKIVPKAKINTDKQIEQIKAEVHILRTLRQPNCVTLHCTFQDDHFLYYVFNYIPGGSLHFHLHTLERFAEPVARFYVGEIILAFEYLHSKNIIFRDLKPENSMLSRDGHVVLVDFGSAKKLRQDERTSTFVGTPHYMAPEVLRGQPYTFSADWWSLGILLFEMLTGETPFQSSDRVELYRSVLRGTVEYPEIISPRARDLLTKLIERNTDVRLGTRALGAEREVCAVDLKSHPFFSCSPMSDEELERYKETQQRWSRQRYGMAGAVSDVMKRMTRRAINMQRQYRGESNTWEWEDLEERQVQPPLRPKLANPLDTQFFDTAVTVTPPTLDNEPRNFQRACDIDSFDYLISSLPPEEVAQEPSISFNGCEGTSSIRSGTV